MHTSRVPMPERGPSQRARQIGASATMAAAEKARVLRRQGVKVLDLGPGQPDFDTPEHLPAAGVPASRSGRTRSPPAPGLPRRNAIGHRIDHLARLATAPETLDSVPPEAE